MSMSMNNNPRKNPRKGFYMLGYLPFTLYTIEMHFEHLNKYMKMVSSYLDSEAQLFKEKLKARVKEKGYNDEEADHFYESHEDDLICLDESFPTTIRYSVVISACSLFESGLTDICKSLNRDENVNKVISWEKLERINKIEQALDFLKKNFSICLTSHPFWNMIHNYFLIRNAIIHAQGHVLIVAEDKRKKLREAIKSLSKFGIKEGKYKKIEIKGVFLDKMVCDIIVYWRDFGKALENNNIIGPIYWP